MKNENVYIIVEGQSEQTFVRDVLGPYTALNGIFLHPVLIGKPGHKGGSISFERAKTDISNLLKQRKDTIVSTMFDFFRIDPNWPGRQSIAQKKETGAVLSAEAKATLLEEATYREIVDLIPAYDVAGRFIPYFSMHEFEALLFSDASILARIVKVDAEDIGKILEECNEPEEINDHPEQAPSKRLMKMNATYRKVAMGKEIATSIGIQKIRQRCSHFSGWLTRLAIRSRRGNKTKSN